MLPNGATLRRGSLFWFGLTLWLRRRLPGRIRTDPGVAPDKKVWFASHRAWRRCSSRMSPRELPIYELESAIVASLKAQGRLIVQAPTGSGKSTQLPQMLLAHGLLGERDQVVVLQPRRLAARLLAKRVAQEAGTSLGEGVGYQIRLES